MNQKYLVPLMLLFAVVFSNCSKKSSYSSAPVVTSYNFIISLSGANEVSPISSSATGSGTATYNTTTKTFSMNVIFNGLTAIGAHIHNGLPGVNGAIEFNLTPSSPISFTTVLTASQETDLLENKYYVNIHSTMYSGGEIRGQITKQ